MNKYYINLSDELKNWSDITIECSSSVDEMTELKESFIKTIENGDKTSFSDYLTSKGIIFSVMDDLIII